MTHIKLRRIVSNGHLHGLRATGLDLEIALEPDALHRETQRRLSTSANAHNQPLVLERGYTNLGQLDHLTLRSPDTTSQQSYQYDALGRMSFRSLEGDPASKVIAYSYDAAGRLIGSQHGDHAHRYSVDAAGNRLESQDNQQALPDNRLTQLNGARYRYDGAGNLIERQQPNGERLTLGYDGANRLVHLTHDSELGYTREATYRYDGLGRRISKTVRHTNGTTATTHYGWDGDRIVREETEKQRTTVVYEPGSFVPMLRIDDTQQGPLVSAYITDALGSPMQLVTPSGQPRWLAEPDDWAAVKNQRAVRNVTQPIRFQGQWHDEESGLYYNRHRYYDPQQGRYISQDPIGLNGGTNLYGYVTNPTGMVDPLGLSGLAGSRPDSRALMGMGGSRASSMNNGIIETCISDVEDWMKVPDYSGAVNARNSVMAVLSKKPGVGFFAQFLEAATIHGVCAHQNNDGSRLNRDTGELIPNFEIWPGPVPEDAHFDHQIGVPGNPRSAVRKVLKDGGAEASKDNGLDVNPYKYTR
ncbi:RHS repeat-associated core domain-containing protein [Halomonas sp. M1]|uniref:RHS repeat-associated core domain-containing protein n=1 Tax=Halomonas sp. M1 TaxID=3035470 RepID=UPI002485548F|nr:RHS repeat-associated core domain-containing protein [Halomonas sp. M1]WFE71025.1 RHS repeat-associated core domain-containing protein [Halomonas sp. M1]